MFSWLRFQHSPFIFSFLILLFSMESVHALSSRESRNENPKDPVLVGEAVMAIVSLDDQTISLFDRHGQRLKSRISSGQRSYETPVGIYSVLQKEVDHFSNIYDDAAMPFMQRITWSGLSLHAGDLPGYPASHGCVRLPIAFAEKIYGLTRLGMRVIVARNEVTPVDLFHPALFQPQVQNLESENENPLPSSFAEEGLFNETLMPDVQRWPLRHQQQQQLKQKALALHLKAQELGGLLELPKTKVEDIKDQRDEILKQLKQTEAARKKLDKALFYAESVFRRTKNAKDMTAASNERLAVLQKQTNLDFELQKIREEIQKTDAALQDAEAELKASEANYQEALREANEAKVRMLPISVLVSLKTQRVYVRQGLEQLMESEISIENPEEPIGTHIYTALDYDETGKEVQWNAVSLPKSDPGIYTIASNDPYSVKRPQVQNSLTHLRDAHVALQRIQLPPEIQKRVSEFVWPGSSLIITDEEPHKETGKATEFIVLVSGEPQGGILKRPRWDPYRNFNSYWGAILNLEDEDDRRKYERERRRFEKEMRRLEKRRQRYWYEW